MTNDEISHSIQELYHLAYALAYDLHSTRPDVEQSVMLGTICSVVVTLNMINPRIMMSNPLYVISHSELPEAPRMTNQELNGRINELIIKAKELIHELMRGVPNTEQAPILGALGVMLILSDIIEK